MSSDRISLINKKTYIGEVISNKMDKSIVIAVKTKTLHKLYKKYVQWTKKFMAHDEHNQARVGDIVRIVESKPISKRKTWRVSEIIENAQ